MVKWSSFEAFFLLFRWDGGLSAIEIQPEDDNTESNLFIQAHLTSRHSSAPPPSPPPPCFMKETGGALISWVKSGKWKCCICILICPQSGIVFGIAVELLAPRRPTMATKFKSACDLAEWRWGSFVSFLPLLLLLLLTSTPHALHLPVFLAPPSHAARRASGFHYWFHAPRHSRSQEDPAVEGRRPRSAHHHLSPLPIHFSCSIIYNAAFSFPSSGEIVWISCCL